MNVEDVIARVDEIFVEEFELERDQVVPAATLREDLGLDSLDALDLIVLLEKEFGVRVEEDDLMAMRTVAEVHAYVRDRFQARAAS